MSEYWRARLERMVDEGDIGAKWDLSPNDRHAIRRALARIKDLEPHGTAEREWAKHALGECVVGDCHYCERERVKP